MSIIEHDPVFSDLEPWSTMTLLGKVAPLGTEALTKQTRVAYRRYRLADQKWRTMDMLARSLRSDLWSVRRASNIAIDELQESRDDNQWNRDRAQHEVMACLIALRIKRGLTIRGRLLTIRFAQSVYS